MFRFLYSHLSCSAPHRVLAYGCIQRLLGSAHCMNAYRSNALPPSAFVMGSSVFTSQLALHFCCRGGIERFTGTLLSKTMAHVSRDGQVSYAKSGGLESACKCRLKFRPHQLHVWHCPFD